MKHAQAMLAAGLMLATGLLAACARAPSQGWGEGLNVAELPEPVRDDYAVYASRCSKCHSLSRSLNSGIDDDVFWALYVARMRRQPASGISPEDETVILRFLHYFSLEVRKRRTPPAQGRLDAPAVTTRAAF